jgi:hypothetical protein
MIMNSEKLRIWKEVAVSCLKGLSGQLPGDKREEATHDPRQVPHRYLIGVTHEHKFTELPLHQRDW